MIQAVRRSAIPPLQDFRRNPGAMGHPAYLSVDICTLCLTTYNRLECNQAYSWTYKWTKAEIRRSMMKSGQIYSRVLMLILLY